VPVAEGDRGIEEVARLQAGVGHRLEGRLQPEAVGARGVGQARGVDGRRRIGGLRRERGAKAGGGKEGQRADPGASGAQPRLERCRVGTERADHADAGDGDLPHGSVFLLLSAFFHAGAPVSSDGLVTGPPARVCT